jgi:hypothetical protein
LSDGLTVAVMIATPEQSSTFELQAVSAPHVRALQSGGAVHVVR